MRFYETDTVAEACLSKNLRRADETEYMLTSKSRVHVVKGLC